MDAQEIDVISAMMAVTSYRNTKNLIVMGGEVMGTLHEDAFRSAVRQASIRIPTMTSVLREVREEWHFFLVRKPRPEAEVPVFVAEFPRSLAGRPSLDLAMEHLTPRLDKQWDIFQDPPTEIHVLRSGSERFFVVFVIHHLCADAAMALRIVTEVLRRYESVLTGRQSQWSNTTPVFSTSRKSAAAGGEFGWKDLLSQMRRDLRYRRDRPVMPVGSGDAHDLREWHIREVLSAEDTAAFLRGVAQDSFHVVDHLVACTNLALHEWNAQRRVPPGAITSVVTVNMRQRFGGGEEQNYSSALFFRTTPADRQAYPGLVGLVARARDRQLAKRVDLSLRRSLSRGAKWFSIFPLAIRRRIGHTFMMHQRYSVAVGFLGSVWPEEGSSGSRAHSRFRRIGDLAIVDVYGTGYKLTGNAAINLYAYVYGEQLHLIMAMPARLLAKHESRSLLGLILQHIGRVSRVAPRQMAVQT